LIRTKRINYIICLKHKRTRSNADFIREKEKGQIDLDCSKFSSGIYFINLQTEKGILTEKLIIE